MDTLNRRNFIKTTLLATVPIAGTGLMLYGKRETTLPNIIILQADDLCSYALGCYGNREVRTPHIDQLGSEGIIFNRHYVSTSICMASRASVFTGQYEYRHGCNFLRGNLTEEQWQQSYPVLLREAGYFTGYAGKFGVAQIKNREDSFDMWGGIGEQADYNTANIPSMAHYASEFPHSTLAYGAFGRDFIKTASASGKPFCLSIGFKAPHQPDTPDPQFDDIYQDTVFSKPANFGRENGRHLSIQSRQGRQYSLFKTWHYPDNYIGVMKTYHQQVYGVDCALGIIREELQNSGVADNTVIIFTSDNGYICGSHGYASKVLPLEESVNVPLIIYDPRQTAGCRQKRCNALTGNIDLAPTILSMAGLPVPENMDGRNMTPLLRHPESQIRDHLALMNVWSRKPSEIPTFYLSTVTQKWKYTYWWYADDGMEPVEELFDMVEDRAEMNNLAADPEYSNELEEMRTKYDTNLEHWISHCAPHYSMYATLFDRAVPWQEKEPLITSAEKETWIEGYGLDQNFPNPFNSATTITYHLNTADHVQIKIVNLAGQEIETLYHGFQKAGDHKLIWQAQNVPTGVYCCRLETVSFSLTKKLILIK